MSHGHSQPYQTWNVKNNGGQFISLQYPRLLQYYRNLLHGGSDGESKYATTNYGILYNRGNYCGKPDHISVKHFAVRTMIFLWVLYF